MRESPLTEDLSALVRRGTASPSEERRLQILLGASPVDRFLDALGRDAEQEPLADPRDAGLLARAVARAAAPSSRHPQQGRRRIVTALMSAALLGTTLAAAWTLPPWLERRAATPLAANSQCPTGIAPFGSGPLRAGRAPVASAATSPAAASPVAASPVAAARPAASGKAAGVASATEPPATAAEQFAKANALRRSGQLPAAVAAYWQLQRAFPSSPEAHLSHVVLGRLLLQQGSAAAAQEQFARYLRATPGGSLAEEAMFGQATALRQSGRAAEERQVLTTLLARFPGSITARAARARLDELD